jgi:hypothetical protein
MQSTMIRDVLIATPGVQSVGSVAVHELAGGETLVTARLGFAPATPTADIVFLLDVARAGIRELVPEAADIVLEPEIAAPRDDANPPTDIFVIRGAD